MGLLHHLYLSSTQRCVSKVHRRVHHSRPPHWLSTALPLALPTLVPWGAGTSRSCQGEPQGCVRCTTRGLLPKVGLVLGRTRGCAENQDPGVSTIPASHGGSGYAEVKVARNGVQMKLHSFWDRKNLAHPNGRVGRPFLSWPGPTPVLEGEASQSWPGHCMWQADFKGGCQSMLPDGSQLRKANEQEKTPREKKQATKIFPRASLRSGTVGVFFLFLFLGFF